MRYDGKRLDIKEGLGRIDEYKNDMVLNKYIK